MREIITTVLLELMNTIIVFCNVRGIRIYNRLENNSQANDYDIMFHLLSADKYIYEVVHM